MGNDCVYFQRDKLCRHFLQSRGIALSPAVFNVNVPVFHITEFAQLCADRVDFFDVTGSRSGAEKSDAPDLTLGARAERCSEEAYAQCGRKFPACNHSMTLSARSKIESGILIAIVFAVF